MTVETKKRINSRGRSRLGCTSCKKSKIKCDELRPMCSRCAKRGLHCSYPFQVSFEKSMFMYMEQNKGISLKEGSKGPFMPIATPSSFEKTQAGNVAKAQTEPTPPKVVEKRAASDVIRSLLQTANESKHKEVHDFANVVKIKRGGSS